MFTLQAPGLFAALTLALSDTPPPSPEGLLITEVCDGTLFGGQPKWVQLTNTGRDEIPDLSVYSIGNYNNGGLVLGGGAATVLNSVPLPAGSSYVFAYESSSHTLCDPTQLTTCFEFTYGFPPDQYSGAFINGDDTIALFLGAAIGDGSNATLVDIYGEIGVDGSGEPWEYTDSFAYRITDVPSPLFRACDWVMAGPDALEDPGGDPAELLLLQSLTTPTTHTGGGTGCTAIVYCTPKINSLGCSPTLTPDPGQPVFGGPSWFLRANGLINSKPAIFLHGCGRSEMPFLGGILCIQPPLKMTPPISSGGNPPPDDCSGQLLVDVTALGFGAGDIVQFQAWSSDPADTLGTSLSDACEVFIGP